MLLRNGIELVALYVGFAAMAWLIGERVIFQPHRSSYRDSGNILKLTTASGKRISAVHLPNPTAQYTLLVSHGNAEDLGDDLPWLDELQAAGFSVFAYDYEGYGTSEGRPREAAAYEDEQAAYNYLLQKVGLTPDRIVVYGRSVGTGPAVWLASRNPVAGLVLQSPFLSALRVVTRITIFPFDYFPNYKRIGDVHCPVLVMHGTSDEVIGFHHGEAMYALAREPKRKLWVAGAHHNDFNYVGRTQYLDALRQFVTGLHASSAPAAQQAP
jgi:fermentation-respiration switch protein FrsA (DUF1100 family)